MKPKQKEWTGSGTQIGCKDGDQVIVTVHKEFTGKMTLMENV